MTAKRKAYLLALAAWPLFLVSAVTLGAVRETVIAPSLGEQAAHVIGALLFIVAMLAIMRGVRVQDRRLSAAVRPVADWRDVVRR